MLVARRADQFTVCRLIGSVPRISRRLILEDQFFLTVGWSLAGESFWNDKCSSIFLIGKTGKTLEVFPKGGWASRGLVAKGSLGA
jgi:hypothetical protein